MTWLGDDAPTPFAPTDGWTAYRGSTLFDGTGTTYRRDMTIVVEGSRIHAVAPDDDAAVPDDAEVVDLGGSFVIPGLVDSHQHLATPPNRPAAEAVLRRHVYAGITTVRDMADDLRHISDLARATLVGEIPGPDIAYAALMAGPSFFDDPRTWQVSRGVVPGTVPWMQAITDDTDLVTAVTLARGTGATAIKIYADLSAQLVAAITAEAHRQGLSVWAHAAVFPALSLDVLAAGVDVLSHVNLIAYRHDAASPDTYKDRPPFDPASVDVDGQAIGEVLTRMKETGAVLDATASMWLADELASYPNAPAMAELSAALTARAFREGIPVSTGSDVETTADAAFPWLFEELDFLHRRCGIPAADVLLGATRIGARSAGLEAEAGTIEAGKLANFVILDEDPLADVAHLRSVSCTVKRGRRFPRSDYAPSGS